MRQVGAVMTERVAMFSRMCFVLGSLLVLVVGLVNKDFWAVIYGGLFVLGSCTAEVPKD